MYTLRIRHLPKNDSPERSLYIVQAGCPLAGISRANRRTSAATSGFWNVNATRIVGGVMFHSILYYNRINQETGENEHGGPDKESIDSNLDYARQLDSLLNHN